MSDPARHSQPSDGETEPFICPLTRVRAGAACRIKQLCAAPEVSHRLREMGFCEDQQVRVVSRQSSLQSSLICQVCNVRLGLSPELAETIWVEPLSPQALVA